MTQMQSEKSYKIDEKSLLEEIVITIGEFFDCRIVRSGGEALLHFNDGQKFKLSVTEQEKERRLQNFAGGALLFSYFYYLYT